MYDETTVLESILQLSKTLSNPAFEDDSYDDDDEAAPSAGMVSSSFRDEAPSVTDALFDIEEFNEDTTVIAMISFGNATMQNHVQRCLRSVRARGQWNGRVVIITDSPQNYRDLVSKDPLVYLITPPRKDWEEMPSFPSEKLKFKRFKTFLIDYMTADSRLQDAGHILYLDVDVIVGKPVVPWMKNMWTIGYQRRSARKRKDMSFLYMFGTGNGGKTAHSGVMLLHTKLSNGCLMTWRKYLDRLGLTNSRDQYALRMMRKKSSAQTGCAVMTWNKKELIFPLPKDFVKRNFAQFVHITNTYHAGQTDAHTQKEYLEEILNLTDEERQDPSSLAIIPSGF